MKEVEVQKLSIVDAETVYSLAQSASFSLQNNHSSGFLYNPLSLEEYKKRLSISETSFKVISNKSVIGFSLNLTNAELLRLQEQNVVTYKNNLLNFIFNHSNSDDFLYIEQVVINEEFRKSGAGQILFDATTSKANEFGCKKVYGEIGHAPVKNQASINFCLKQGFSLISEIEYKDRVFGVYFRRQECIS